MSTESTIRPRRAIDDVREICGFLWRDYRYKPIKTEIKAILEIAVGTHDVVIGTYRLASDYWNNTKTLIEDDGEHVTPRQYVKFGGILILDGLLKTSHITIPWLATQVYGLASYAITRINISN